MSDAQKPSVSRAVHFYAARGGISFPYAAVVTDAGHYDDPMTVDLFVFGNRHDNESERIEAVQYSETPTEHARWCWPPRI